MSRGVCKHWKGANKRLYTDRCAATWVFSHKMVVSGLVTDSNRQLTLEVCNEKQESRECWVVVEFAQSFEFGMFRFARIMNEVRQVRYWRSDIKRGHDA